MFLSKGSVIILFVVIATCIHVNSVEGLRTKRQSGNSGSTTAAPSTTPPPSSDSSSSSSGSSSKGNKGLLTTIGDLLKPIPVAGYIVAPLLYFVGGLLGGIIGFLG